jgi:predicted TIM-barrel fold metal-dependent hydrolase
MAKTLCISADSHVVEPPEMFAPLEKRFGERAPRIRTTEDRGPQLDLGDGRLGLAIGGFLQAGFDFGRPDSREQLKRGYDLARPGVYDIKARIADQDRDGIDAEVVYPSVLFNVYQVKDNEVVKAAFASYNDWTANYCSVAPERLFPLAALQLRDLDAAIAEMERAKKLGHVGVCIPATAPPDHLYSDPWYDKFWAAAQDMKMPLTMHIFTGATDNHGLPFRQAGSALAFAGVMFTIADLIQSGVCERFPDLRFVPTEFETGWVGIMLKRLDWSWFRFGGAKAPGAMPEKPSFYWKRNFLVTFEDDEIGVMTRYISGSNTLMWGSDYPHGDSVFPNSQDVLDRILKDCTADERYEMTVKNVVQLYDLPFEV